LAQFSVTADSINAAVKNSYMTFSDTGLTLLFKKDKGDSIFKGKFEINKQSWDEASEQYVTEKIF
jgi:hypothetical protein